MISSYDPNLAIFQTVTVVDIFCGFRLLLFCIVAHSFGFLLLFLGFLTILPISALALATAKENIP